MTTQTDPLAPYQVPLVTELRRATGQLSHHRLMRYHLGLEGEQLEAGARFRGGCLCLAVTEALGGVAAQALPVAVAAELLQNLVLIQADLHFDHERRDGRATLARSWGVPLALNSEDGMFALAQVVLGRLAETGVDPARAAACQRRFDAAVLRLCERLPAWGNGTAKTAAAADLTLELAAALATPLGAGVAAAATIAGADDRSADALVGYGEALGAILALPADQAAAAATLTPDLAAAAAAALDAADLASGERERLRGLAEFITGGTK